VIVIDDSRDRVQLRAMNRADDLRTTSAWWRESPLAEVAREVGHSPEATDEAGETQHSFRIAASSCSWSATSSMAGG